MRPLLLAALACAGCGPAPAPDGPEGSRDAGVYREYWSISRRQGDGATTHRVNSPDTATGRFKDRPEAKADGTLRITVEEDPATLRHAVLYLELWGGHPGTARKTVSLNGHPPVPIPEVGAAEKNCTYSYPEIRFPAAQLVRGENLFRFSCERGSTFWGHFLFEIACLRVYPERSPLGPFAAAVDAESSGEEVRLALGTATPDRIASVEYLGRYHGYDENGDGRWDDWHGFTKEGRSQAVLGTSTRPPFAVTWDRSMLPDPAAAEIRARIRFKGAPDLVCLTRAVLLPAPERAALVRLERSEELPRPFWSRASRPRSCTIVLDGDPGRIERAELHVAIWDGGKGSTPDPFTINGHPLPVAGEGAHDLLYRAVPVDPAWLRRGPNEIRVLSDTKHHGIEVLLPGPALILRTRP